MKINTMIISKFEKNLREIRSMAEDEDIIIIGESSGGTLALDKIENLSPDIIIMTLGIDDTDVLNLAERVILHKPRTHIIFITEYMDVEILQSIISIGAHNVIEFPKSAKEFKEYIKSVYNHETTRINSLIDKQNLSWMSRVITIFGVKGGLGKSTIASNLAIKLAENNKKVILLDLDLQFGDIHIFLDIDPQDTISELVQEPHTTNIDSIRKFMTVHSSGVHVLCAPKSPEYAEMISSEKIQALLSLLRSYYDYVIIDTPPFFTEVTMAAIEGSSIILFVTGLDISILKNSKLSLSLLESLQQRDKIRLIVNRAVEMSSITLNDIKDILGYPIWAKLPSDYKVAVSSLNKGSPFVISEPDSKLSQSITAIANSLLKGTDENETIKIGIEESQGKMSKLLERLKR